MTVDEVLALAARLPPKVTRIEVTEPGGISFVIEQAAQYAPPVPMIGDVEKANAAREKAAKPSDVASLSEVRHFDQGD